VYSDSKINRKCASSAGIFYDGGYGDNEGTSNYNSASSEFSSASDGTISGSNNFK